MTSVVISTRKYLDGVGGWRCSRCLVYEIIGLMKSKSILRDRIQNKFSKLFKVNNDLRKIAKSMIDLNPQVNSPKDGVACYMLAKAYKTHGVIMKLARLGYSEDADMLARTLFDVAIIISACIDDKNDDTVSKYLKFDDSTRSQMYRQLINEGKFQEYFEERASNPKAGDEPISEIYERAEKGIAEYGGDFRRKWHSGKTSSQMAESVKLKQYFDTAYNLQSQLVHSLPRCMNRYFIDDGKNIFIDIKPKENEINLTLISTFNIFFVIIQKFNDHYKYIPDNTFKPLVDDFVTAAKPFFDPYYTNNK